MKNLSRNSNNPYLEESKKRLSKEVFGVAGVLGVGTALDPVLGPSGWYFFVYVIFKEEVYEDLLPKEWEGFPVRVESIISSIRQEL